MTMEATYGKVREQESYLLPTGMNSLRTVPVDNQSGNSTVLVRTRAGDNIAACRTLTMPGGLSHHRQASVHLQDNVDYENTVNRTAQEDDSVQYFVLEKPPDYNGRQ